MGGILNMWKKDGLIDNVIKLVTNHLKKVKVGPKVLEINMWYKTQKPLKRI